MKKEKLVIVGTGQLSQDIRFFVERYDLFEIIGYAINKEYINADTYMGKPIYPVEELEKYVDSSEVYAYIAISWFHYLNRERKNMYESLKERGFKMANLISPNATILTDDIGDGNWVCDFAYLDYQTQLGSNNVLRNYAYVGHYVSVGDHCFLGAKSLIGGNTTIGNQCFIGICATVFNNCQIGEKCIIGGSAVVKKSIPDYCLCKVPNASIEIKQYDKDTIENKLTPGGRKTKEYNIKEEGVNDETK